MPFDILFYRILLKKHINFCKRYMTVRDLLKNSTDLVIPVQ